MDHINKTYIELDQDMDTNLLKMCLNMMIVMSNKQHLSNSWSWVHKKGKLGKLHARLFQHYRVIEKHS